MDQAVAQAATTPGWRAEDETRIPLWLYTDRANYQRELEQLFYGPHWHYVGVDVEVPNVGDYKRTLIGERTVIMVRDKDGGITVLNNHCAHRGTEICQSHFGNLPKGQIMCPYHNWTYDFKGALTGVPFRRGVKGKGGFGADFRLEEHSLKRLRVTVINGGVFATFDQDGLSLEEYFGDEMLTYVKRMFNGKKLKVLGYQRQKLKGNWKLYMENIKDPYHATLLHVFLVSFGIYRVDQVGKLTQDARTHSHCVIASQRNRADDSAGAEEMSHSFKPEFELKDPRMVIPAQEFPDAISILIQSLFPATIFQQQTNSLQVRYLIPLGPDAFELSWTYLGYDDDDAEMNMRRVRMANLTGPSGFVSVDDSEAMEFTGAGIRSNPDGTAILELDGHDPHAPADGHMVTESAIRGFYHHYRQVMGY